MAKFSKDYGCEYYRFVDDMTIAVNDKVIGKKALKCLTDSLRRLNLVSSIEKTSIIGCDEAEKELFFKENSFISELEKEVINKIKNKENLDNTLTKIKNYYSILTSEKKDKYKNWHKILKRFYTVCTYSKCDLLINEVKNHIIDYPLIISGDKIGKYLLQIKDDKDKLLSVIRDLIDYIYTDENLYPGVESNIFETLLLFEKGDLNDELVNKIKELALNIFYKNEIKPQSDYSRSLSCLLLYRYGEVNNITDIANHYIESEESDYLLKKYLIFVSLTTSNKSLKEKIINKAKKEQNISISRLINFVENINNFNKSELKVIERYINKNELYILFKKEEDLKLKIKYNPVRAEIIKVLVEIYK